MAQNYDYDEDQRLKAFSKETVGIADEYSEARMSYAVAKLKMDNRLVDAYADKTIKETLAMDKAYIKVTIDNPEAKKEIIERAKKEDVKDVDRHGKTGAQTIKSILKEEVIHQVRASVQDNEEAKVLAKALLHDLSYKMVQCQCKAIGLPELRPAQVVELENVSDLFSRKYYVEKAIHEIGKKGYETSFWVKGNRYHESY